MEKGLVIGLGEVLWDMLPQGKMLGGAPANFACHVAALGLPGCVVSAVGCDALGDEILSSLASRGVHCEIERVEQATGTVDVALDDCGIPTYNIRLGSAWDSIQFRPELAALASEARAVCFGSLAQRSAVSRVAINAFVDAMPTDALKVFDINLRQSYYDAGIIQRSLEMCNVLKVNDEEIVVLQKMFSLAGDAEAACRQLLERYDLQVVILTCGARGSYVFSTDYESFMPTPKVEVVDTVGAGDSFTAAFVASLLRAKPEFSLGETLREAHQVATAYAAKNCTHAGPVA